MSKTKRDIIGEALAAAAGPEAVGSIKSAELWLLVDRFLAELWEHGFLLAAHCDGIELADKMSAGICSCGCGNVAVALYRAGHKEPFASGALDPEEMVGLATELLTLSGSGRH